jgi:ABC-type branched-subunit amino acid transport system ATPase component/ABC-type branched-subunit amino acid transport system permease subunit
MLGRARALLWSRVARAFGALGLLLAALVIPPAVSLGSYRLGQIEYLLSAMLVAVGLNIVTGFAGQLSLGPSAVFAFGGYTAAILADHHPSSVGLGVMSVAGIGAGILIGVLIGVPALRVGGFYLGMVTLFFALLIPTVAKTLSFTGASSGISLISNERFSQSPSGMGLYELAVGIVAIVVAGSWLLRHSQVGRRFFALKASEELAASLGIVGYRTKLLAFLLSAAPAGLAGALYVYTQQFFSPGSANVDLSIYLLAGCVIGGFGTILGPALGTALVFGLTEFLGGLAEYQGIIFGIVLLAVVTVVPDGFMGASWWRKLGRSDPDREFEGSMERPSSGASGVLEEALFKPSRGPSRWPVRPGEAVELKGEGLERSFGGVRAVDGLDILLSLGRVHALIGPNGSGKTTVLNLLSGFHRPGKGRILLGDEVVSGLSPAALARRGVARSFQTPKLMLSESLLYNVVIAAQAQERSSDLASVLRLPSGRRASRRAVERAMASLEFVGLAASSHLLASEVPHGTERLVEIARAIALGPRFVLLDEPAAGLSPAEMSLLTPLVRRMAASGVAVLVVEHNLPLVLGMADEVTVLDHGRCVARGTPESIARDPEVARVYVGAAQSEPARDSERS